MAKIKIAVAQIYFKPAMIMKGHDLLVEPFGDTDTSISTLKFPGDSKLQRESKEAYLSWIKLKIISILRAAINHNVRIIVFPEYSIPYEIINDIHVALRSTTTVVVAGTHMVTNSHDYKYKPKGYPSTKQIIRCAMCPIISSAGVEHFVLKVHASGPEFGSINLPKSHIPQPLNMGKLSLHVRICIDAITLDDHFPDGGSNIFAIPSWSNSVEPFDALAIISKFNEWPIMYANCADVGGSTVSAPYLKSDTHWFLNNPLNKSIPKSTEGVIIANVDVDYSKHSVGTVNISPSASIEAIYNIFYRNNEHHKKTMNTIETYLEHTSI